MCVRFLSTFLMLLLLITKINSMEKDTKIYSMEKDTNILDVGPINLANCANFLSLRDFYNFYEVIQGDNRTKNMRKMLEFYLFKKCQKRILKSRKFFEYIVRSDGEGDTKMPKNILQILKFEKRPDYHTLVLYENKTFDIFGRFYDQEFGLTQNYQMSHKDLTMVNTSEPMVDILGIAYFNGVDPDVFNEPYLHGKNLQKYGLSFNIFGRVRNYRIGYDPDCKSDDYNIINLRNSLGYVKFIKKSSTALIYVLKFDENNKLLKIEGDWLMRNRIEDERIQDIFDADVNPDEYDSAMDILLQYILWK